MRDEVVGSTVFPVIPLLTSFLDRKRKRFLAFARNDNMGKAVSSYRSLPHWGRGTAQRRSGALVNGALETIFFPLFHPARTLSGSLRSPPSPRGEGC